MVAETPNPPSFRRLSTGDRLPSFAQSPAEGPALSFDALAGRYQLFGFVMGDDVGDALAALEALSAHPELFDDRHCAVTLVTRHPSKAERRLPGLRFVTDAQLELARACGAAAVGEGPAFGRRLWILVDPSLHVLRVENMGDWPLERLIADVAALPPPDRFGGVARPAPILMLPNVLEPELCERLIGLYTAAGGEASGVVRGHARAMDADFKRRRDHTIGEPEVLDRLVNRITRRVMPEIERLFFMKASYIERHLVGCYAAEDGGHFAPHTDNAAGLTRHRRFALSINLNDDFEGGEVVFPEYNLEGYKAPAGWAVVFPCAALHAVRRVTRGARFAYLPFLYDEAGRAIRESYRGPPDDRGASGV